MTQEEIKKGCNVEFPFFGASYPDAKCVDGNLMDMDKCDEDGNLYSTEEYNPCPICCKKEFIEIQLDNEVPIEQIEQHINMITEKYVNRHIKSKLNLELNKQLTFDEFIQHGIDNGANMKNGIPWSWHINGEPVTHENDQCYLISTREGIKMFERGDFIVALEGGLRILTNSIGTHAPGSCPL